MIERHKATREAPPTQRPPNGKGWSRRRSDTLDGVTVWRLWAPTADGRILQAQVIVSDLQISLAGRWTAALQLKQARLALRQALVA